MAETTISSAIEQAVTFYQEGRLDAAKTVLEDAITQVETSNAYKIGCYSFSEAMEEVLYQYDRHPDTDVGTTDEPVSTLYLVYGSILAGSGEIMRGQDALKKARQWNPASCDVLLEYAETYRMLGNYEAYREVAVRAFRFAFLPEQVARCLNCIGNYFGLLQMWPEALGYYVLSFNYDRDSSTVKKEIDYASKQAAIFPEDIDFEHLREISGEYGTPLGANEGVIRLAQSLALRAQGNRDEEAARYFQEIADALTKGEGLV